MTDRPGPGAAGNVVAALASTAAELQERLHAALHRAGVARASINVSILAIESPLPASLGSGR